MSTPKQNAPGGRPAGATLPAGVEYRDDYPSEPIGGGNPYYRCMVCGRSAPEINGRIDGHYEWCSWRQQHERTADAREDALRRAGAAGLLPDPDVAGVDAPDAAILGWFNPDTGKTCSVDEKHSMEKHQGLPGVTVARGFRIPLVAADGVMGDAEPSRTDMLAAFEGATFRMGQLWERCQGKGWSDADSETFTNLRDERVPKLRAALGVKEVPRG